MQLSPYLSFDGCCETAFKFYEQCLGGKIEAMMPYKGSPMETEVSMEWANKVMHGEFKVGEFVVMGSDCMPGKHEKAKGTALMIGIEDPAEAERVFNALAENGVVTMPIQETFWAEKFGMLEDQFGIPWMINCDRAA
ncbi:MAG: VOC family protein [Cyanobacteria bacterium J06627_3]